ncbi:MAG: HD domain-containing protein [Candidatus Marsarchaeota archaeon]|nr:HD domain-containing protein [Candidatus Marsarchaeota archaeon]
MAGKAYDMLTRNPKYRDRLKSVLNYDDDGIDRARRIVRLAALLHDIGHAPFSHAAETLMPIDASKPAKSGKPVYYSHEQYSAAIIRTFFREAIDDNKFIKTNAGITADDVAGLLEGDPKLASHLFWRDILSSQMDVDRMDYLLRDSYHCGVRYGIYDLDRLLHTLAITFEIPEPNGEGSEANPGLTIGVEEGGLHAAEELILSRYAMFTQVYFHKARRAYDHHLEQVLRGALKGGRFPAPDKKKSLQDYLAWDDWRVMGIIVRNKSDEHARRIKERDHYREVHHTDEVPSMDDIDNFRAVADALGQIVKLEDSADKSWYKFEKEEIVVERDNGLRVQLSDICFSVKGLHGVKQMRLYADRTNKDRAREIKNKLDGKKVKADDDS